MIATVFKPSRLRNGRRVRARTYTARYQVAGMSKPRQVALGVTDKRVAEQRLAELVKRAELEAAGLAVPADLAESMRRPLTDHLRAFLDDHRLRGSSRQYRVHVEGRVGRLIRDCRWSRLADVDAASFLAWRQSSPRSEQHDRPLSPKTLNDHLDAIRAVLGWLVKRGRLSVDPLASIDKLGVRGRQGKRRALTVDEARRLIASAGERGVVYHTALVTAFRRRTLYTLCWSNLDLDADPPTVTAEAEHVKNGTREVRVLTADLAADLRALRDRRAAQDRGCRGTGSLAPGGRVFDGLLPHNGLDFLRDDLADAGIEEVNDAGERMDFHALRHTACTLGGMTGVAGPTLQAFTGHRTESQLRRYVHAEHLPQRAVVDRLPRLVGVSDDARDDAHIDAQIVPATGRFGSPAVASCRNGGVSQTLEKQGSETQTGGDSRRLSQVEPRGLEPLTSCMPCTRSPN